MDGQIDESTEGFSGVRVRRRAAVEKLRQEVSHPTLQMSRPDVVSLHLAGLHDEQ